MCTQKVVIWNVLRYERISLAILSSWAKLGFFSNRRLLLSLCLWLNNIRLLLVHTRHKIKHTSLRLFSTCRLLLLVILSILRNRWSRLFLSFLFCRRWLDEWKAWIRCRWLLSLNISRCFFLQWMRGPKLFRCLINIFRLFTAIIHWLLRCRAYWHSRK